jgi:hypothetical protein
MANLRRRLDRDFVAQEADHTARIEGENLNISWKYSGYCRAGHASAFDFSVDSGIGTSFEDLNCVAYDLGHDPDMVHEIRPLLVGLAPSWIRVYDCSDQRGPVLLKSLTHARQEQDLCEYIDVPENVPGR